MGKLFQFLLSHFMIAAVAAAFYLTNFPGKFTGIFGFVLFGFCVLLLLLLVLSCYLVVVTEFMALCGLLAQFLNAKFQCLMHISTCIIMTVCCTLFAYYNFSENRITFPVSVIKMCQKLLLNCAEMFSS